MADASGAVRGRHVAIATGCSPGEQLRLPAHLIELGLRGCLLGEDRSLDAVLAQGCWTPVEQGALGWLNLLRVKVNPQVDEARRKEVRRGVQRRARAIRDFKTSAPEKPTLFGP